MHTPEQMEKALAMMIEGITVGWDTDYDGTDKLTYQSEDMRPAEFWRTLNNLKPKPPLIVALATAYDALHPGEQPPYVVVSRATALHARYTIRYAADTCPWTPDETARDEKALTELDSALGR